MKAGAAQRPSRIDSGQLIDASDQLIPRLLGRIRQRANGNGLPTGQMDFERAILRLVFARLQGADGRHVIQTDVEFVEDVMH